MKLHLRNASLLLALGVLATQFSMAGAKKHHTVDNEESSTEGLVTTSRAAPMRYAPTLAAPVVQNLQANTQLHWLDGQKRNGYDRVAIDKGHSGWVLSSAVQVTHAKMLIGLEAFAACANQLDQCTNIGCAAAGSADALSNTLKHHIPSTTSATSLTFDDFASLQQQADQTVGSGVHIPPADRSALANLTVSTGSVSEGDAVRVVGYLVTSGTGPHPNSSGESVNCGLQGADNNDFHIPVTMSPDGTEFEAIVVEMIPQDRPDNWTIPKLKAVQSRGQQVLIRGNLFYDSQHRVNADAANPLGGQPKRFSLWEVHPVTEFLVCQKASCDPENEQDWSKL